MKKKIITGLVPIGILIASVFIYLELTSEKRELDFLINDAFEHKDIFLDYKKDTSKKSRKKIFEMGEAVLPKVIEYMIKDDGETANCYELSMYFKKYGDRAIRLLIESYKSDEIDYFIETHDYVEEFGREAIPVLLNYIEHENYSIVYNSLINLKSLLRRDDDYVKIIPFIKHTNKEIRVEAIRILGEIGKDDVIPLLAQSAKFDCINTKIISSAYLIKFGRDKYKRIIYDSLKSKIEENRSLAIWGIINAELKSFVPDLIELIDKEEKKDMVCYILMVLGNLATEEAVNYLYSALHHEKDYICAEAQKILKDKDLKRPANR